jgi:hypothetical protein
MVLKRTLYTLSVLSLLVLFSVNCSGPAGKKRIPEKKFVNVLADIHLADGIGVDQISNSSSLFVLDSASLYGSVFRKYNVTREQFDNTMTFYATHPDDCSRMFDKVIARLKMMEEELKKNQQEQVKKPE